jgi:hypothetical protein
MDTAGASGGRRCALVKPLFAGKSERLSKTYRPAGGVDGQRRWSRRLKELLNERIQEFGLRRHNTVTGAIHPCRMRKAIGNFGAV